MTTSNDWRELATREADGLLVTLIWSGREGRVTVAVTDTWLYRQFEITVAGDRALDAFRHPFLYAGSEIDAPLPTPAREVAA
jgi:hypothetical protein